MTICLAYYRVVRSAQGIVLAISSSATRLVRRILCQLVAKAGHTCLIHLSNLSFKRLLGEENGVLAPLNRQGRRDKGPRTRLEPREVSRRSAHSQAQKFRWPMMSMLPSRLLECTRQVSPPALPPGQVRLFLNPTRAIFQPLWEKPRAEREDCLSKLPRSRPLSLKTKFSTDVAGSLLGARRYDFKARPTSPDE